MSVGSAHSEKVFVSMGQPDDPEAAYDKSEVLHQSIRKHGALRPKKSLRRINFGTGKLRGREFFLTPILATLSPPE